MYCRYRVPDRFGGVILRWGIEGLDGYQRASYMRDAPDAKKKEARDGREEGRKKGTRRCNKGFFGDHWVSLDLYGTIIGS